MGAVEGFTLNKFSMGISGACGFHNNSLAARAGQGVVEHFTGRGWYNRRYDMKTRTMCYATRRSLLVSSICYR